VPTTHARCLVHHTRTNLNAVRATDALHEQVLRLQVAVNDVHRMQIVHACADVVHKRRRNGLGDALVFDDVVKQLATVAVLHDEKYLLGAVDDLEQLDDVPIRDAAGTRGDLMDGEHTQLVGAETGITYRCRSRFKMLISRLTRSTSATCIKQCCRGHRERQETKRAAQSSSRTEPA
jgi:hypothetical protein